jgi:hypothetical protein
MSMAGPGYVAAQEIVSTGQKFQQNDQTRKEERDLKARIKAKAERDKHLADQRAKAASEAKAEKARLNQERIRAKAHKEAQEKYEASKPIQVQVKASPSQPSFRQTTNTRSGPHGGLRNGGQSVQNQSKAKTLPNTNNSSMSTLSTATAAEIVAPRMSSKQKKQQNKNKNKQKKKTPKGKKKGGSGERKTVNNFYTTSPAPVNQIPTVHAGPSMSFSGSGKMFHVSARMRIAQIQTNSSSVFGFSTYGAGMTALNTSFAMCPNNSFYFPAFMVNFVQQFRFFKLTNVVLEFLPRVATSSSATYVVGSVDDPGWFEAVGIASGTAVTPTETVLTTLDNCCSVVGYAKCEMKVPCSQQAGPGGWVYTYSNFGNSIINWTATVPSDLRNQIPSALAVVGTGGAASTTYADMYIRFNLALKELTLGQTTQLTLSQLENHLAMAGPDKAMPVIEKFYKKMRDNKSKIVDIEECDTVLTSTRSSSPSPSIKDDDGPPIWVTHSPPKSSSKKKVGA